MSVRFPNGSEFPVMSSVHRLAVGLRVTLNRLARSGKLFNTASLLSQRMYR